MSTKQDISLACENDLRTTARAEISDLRRSLLSWIVTITAISSWVWLYYVVQASNPTSLNQIPVIALPLTACLTHLLYKRWYNWACWALCLGIMLSINAIIAAYPSSKAMSFGALAILIANALLGTWHALLVCALMWLSGTSTQYALNAGSTLIMFGLRNIDMAILYLAVWILGWLTMRPLSIAVAQSLSGWQQANRALAEVRQRRAELYRALRAMEEATYRIEHMNQQLIIARQEAETARALKARFVATVSHELRGPLNLILGFSRLMVLSPELYGAPLPMAYRADIDAIFRNAAHLSTLVDDILDLSQIEAQRLPLVKDRINLKPDVIEKALSVVRPLAERKGLALRVDCPQDLPWILADEVRLRQTLLNLLTNAIRFTTQGEIVIKVTCLEQELLISVQDTGSGIAPENLPKLFREFGQLDPKQRGEQHSSGLGLSIAKEIVELHGGRIWAESTQGVGTTIRFTLPLPGTSPSTRDLVRTEAVGNHHPWKQTCLVVHDNPSVVRLLGRYLEDYHLVGLPDESQVSTLIKSLHPRALITEPQRLASIQAILHQESLDIPIVTCGLPCTMAQQKNSNILGYLIKPISPDSIVAVMGQVEREDETTILLVDDEPDAVRLLETTLMLLPRPYRILRAYSGEEALKLMQHIVPDILFIDLVMPGLDGEATITRMQEDKRLSHVPVVIVSARDIYENQLIVKLPLSVHRQKPVELSKVARLLSAAIENVSQELLVS